MRSQIVVLALILSAAGGCTWGGNRQGMGDGGGGGPPGPDGAPRVDSGPVTMPPEHVNRPPVIYSDPVVDGSEGKTYRYPILAEDRDGDPLTFTVMAGPSGMT